MLFINWLVKFYISYTLIHHIEKMAEAEATPTCELYEKRNATHVKVIGDYANKTRKLVWYEWYNEKCCLASAMPTATGERNLYKMKVSISRDEMQSLYECLLKSKKGGTNDFFLSEGEDC